jgi:nucleoside-diphosphate-sugar epimerase
MRVLILGGTGAIGGHLVDLLKSRGLDLAVTSRSRGGQDGDIQYIQGNAQDMAFLGSILHEKWDAIVDFMVYSTPSFSERVDLFLKSTNQYVVFSSSRIYAESDQPIAEDSARILDVSQDEAFLRTDEYSLSKARQDDILRKSGRTNWTIVRPYITYSQNRLQLGHLEKEHWLFRALRGRTIVFSKDICGKYTTLTYGLDVARSIAALLGRPDAMGSEFNIASERSVLWSDVLDVYLNVLEEHMGSRPKVLLQDLNETIQSAPARYQIVYDRMYNRKFNSAKVGKYIDIDGFTPFDVGVKNCLESFLSRPVFQRIDWRKEAIRDRATGERAALSEMPSIKDKVKYLVRRNVPLNI